MIRVIVLIDESGRCKHAGLLSSPSIFCLQEFGEHVQVIDNSLLRDKKCGNRVV